MTAKELRANARNHLKGRWGMSILVGIVAGLLGADNTYQVFSTSVDTASNTVEQTVQQAQAVDPSAVYSAAQNLPVSFDISTIQVSPLVSILGIVAFIFGGAVALGWCLYNQNLNHDRPAEIKDLFVYFNMFGKAFLTNLLVGLFLLLWTLLLIVPGIIMSFAYSQTFYIMQENPDMKAMEAIRASKELMKGYKWKLFCLDLSFIGWALLAILTFGIGFVFLTPYVEQAHCAFYNNLKAEKAAIPMEPAAAAE